VLLVTSETPYLPSHCEVLIYIGIKVRVGFQSFILIDIPGPPLDLAKTPPIGIMHNAAGIEILLQCRIGRIINRTRGNMPMTWMVYTDLCSSSSKDCHCGLEASFYFKVWVYFEYPLHKVTGAKWFKTTKGEVITGKINSNHSFHAHSHGNIPMLLIKEQIPGFTSHEKSTNDGLERTGHKISLLNRAESWQTMVVAPSRWLSRVGLAKEELVKFDSQRF